MNRVFAIVLTVAALSTALLAFATTAPAQDSVTQQHIERIAAVVNDDVISTSDIRARLRLDMLASGLQPSQDNQQRLLPRVVRTLVNERLQVQEAERFGIEVEEPEIVDALADIAGQNGMSNDSMQALLAENGIPISALVEQIRARISWQRLTRGRLWPSIDIGDEEIDETIARYQANQGRPEYLLAEIFLAVESPEEETEVRQLAEQLVEEIRQDVPFPRVARQFSQAADAANGGDLGWIIEGQLDPALDAAIGRLSPGQLSPPIRTLSGYHILLLRQQRRVAVAESADAVITLHQLALGIPPDSSRAEVERVMATAQSASETIRGCDALVEHAAALDAGHLFDAGSGPMHELPGPIREAVQYLEEGEPSAPIRLPDGVVVYMVCDRESPGLSLPGRDEIRENLAEARLDMLQRRYLRDLRNAAYIDLRV